MIVTGIGETLVGVVSRLRVEGTYSLIGDLTVSFIIAVDLGELSNSAFLLQQQ
ncbi:hypothetical protein D3C83_330350 [compost metagenome]